MKLFGKKEEKPAARPKIDFSDVVSGASSKEILPPPEAPPAPAHEIYVIQKGDTLWKIAKKFYGKGSSWPKIHEANKEAIPNPDLIHPGVESRIPKV